MKILVTGASGFVAGEIIPYLRAGGVDLVLLGRYADKLKTTYPSYICGSYDDWARLAVGVDAVLHLAARNNDADGDIGAFIQDNAALLEAVLNKTKASGIPLFIFTSSVHARPETAAKSHYASSKMVAENVLLAEKGIAIQIYQLAAVYGTAFAGNLAIVMRFPKPLQPLVLKLLGAIRPTLHARRLANAIRHGVSDPRSEHRILSDEQRTNPAFAIFKRGIDLLFAATIAVLFFWLIALVWIAVKISSPGPGIFAQQRVGQYGKVFVCYKFRSMRQGTRQAGTHELSQASVTRIGSLLRKTKIDEFPQIVNIFKGEMSLIGPRPCLPSQTELIEARRKLGVLDVRPGISGLSQIQNIDMSTPERLAQSDAEYVALRSVPLELRIIMATATGNGQGDKTRGD